jgi:methyl-accepting chemotaxis protein
VAINIPIISSFEDKGIAAAKAAFNNFKSAVGDAEGGMKKFKAGSKVALDAVAANAGTFALAAGTAIAGFAVKAIGEFQDLALSAGKFSDATGLAVEDASRYIEAAGDIGVPIDKVESAIGRLNKTIGKDPDKVRDLGVDLVYLKDGSLDVNETFLNTIQRIKDIKDPAEKAKVATELLGKGWQGMAELIEGGADNLRKSLDSVSDSKVISEDDLQNAKDYRDAVDDLKEKFEAVTLEVGKFLVPKLTQVLEIAEKISDTVGLIPDPLIHLATGGFFASADGTPGWAEEKLAGINAEMNKYTSYYRSRIDAIEGVTGAMDDQSDEATELDEAWKGLIGSLQIERAMTSARDQLDQLKEKAVEAFGGSKEAVAEYEAGLIDAQLMVLRLAEDINLTAAQQTRIQVLVETGEIERALDLLDRVRTSGGKLGIEEQRFAGRRALGGPVSPGGSYLVGERGPELFTPSSSGNITPNNALGGGANITVNVNGGDPDAVVRAIQKYARQNGAIPLQTTTGARF